MLQAEGIKLAVGQVRDARSELDPQQMRQGKHMVADPAAVGVMHGDAQVRLMVQQAINDVRRLTRGGDRDGVVWRVPGRDVGVEQRGRLTPVAMPGVVAAHCLTAACGQERLAVGAGHVGGAEQRGKRLALLGVDQGWPRLAGRCPRAGASQWSRPACGSW